MKLILVLTVASMLTGCGAAGRRFREGAAEAAKHPPEVVVCQATTVGNQTEMECRKR